MFSKSLRLWIFIKTFHSNCYCQRSHYYRECRNSVLSLDISDYFRKTTNQLWIENSKMTGLKGCKSCQEKQIFNFPWLKENWLKKMNGSCLINQANMHASTYLTNRRRSFFFSVTIFRAWFYDSQFSKIKFSCSENTGDFSGTYLLWSAMLLKLQAFIPQFNQFHPSFYYRITSLTGYFWIYV